MVTYRLLSLVVLAFCVLTCSPNEAATDAQESTAESPQTTDPTQADETRQELHTGDLRYAWVNRLNVRETPQLDAKVVASVDAQTPLRFSGKTSGQANTIVLRGVAYQEPWLEVTTPDGQNGWVFGGAVHAENEPKGNAPISEQAFNFPYFGTFDLSGWEVVATKDIEEGDVYGKETTYQQGSRKLEVRRTQASEYGYTNTYSLYEGRHLIKERLFQFSAMEGNLITETVTDLLQAQVYERTQTVDRHFMQLNARPEMVRGEWETQAIAEGNGG